MAHILIPKHKIHSLTFDQFKSPFVDLLPLTPELHSRGDRPLKMTFEDQLNALIYFHLQEHKSAR
ncbi:MAG: IS4 family transposase, partial [Desulfobacterales bacterium]|nr:IS4 family transposase [Desulfobacterales bacterium]